MNLKINLFLNLYLPYLILLHFNVAFNQTLKLSNPVGGGNLLCETPFSIQWSGDGASDDVSLYISDNGTDWRNIATTPNDGEHSWSIGPLESTSNTMRIRIIEFNVSGTPLADTSELFTISQNQTDPYEPNNDTSQSHEIVYGDSLTGGFISYVFKDNRDSDWFWFDGQTGDRIRITFYDGPLNYCLFYLYFGDSLITSGRDKVVDLPKSGKYYIRLISLDDYWRDNGRYSLVFKNLSVVPTIFKPITPKLTSLNHIKPKLISNSLQVSFNLAKQDNVSIEIYNIRGQLLQFVDMGQKCAGYYNFNIKMNWVYNTSTGPYLLKMLLGDKPYKMIFTLIK